MAAYGGRAALDQHLISDVLFTEPARHLADGRTTARGGDVPLPLLDHQPGLRAAPGGAPHASEVPFVFDDAAAQRFAVPDAAALADTISDYWVAFATAAVRPTTARPRGRRTTTVDGHGAHRGRAAPGADPWTRRLDAVERGYETRLGGLEELTDAW